MAFNAYPSPTTHQQVERNNKNSTSICKELGHKVMREGI